MTALSAIEEKASELYPSYPLEIGDGTTITLKSMMDLDDTELKLFNASQKRLTAMDESEDVEKLKEEFVSILAGVSDDKARLTEILSGKTLGVLTVLFKDYAGALEEGTKS